MQRHLDRLSSVDAGFLHQEDGRDSHMHIGALTVFDGRPPGLAQLRAHLADRLQLVPRYRQRLAFPPLGTGRPLWVDDASLNLDYHLRRTALPRPGSRQQLLALAERVLSQRLDRTKPLWELWLVEGLAGGRFALLNKTHHALVDGVGGVDIMTALFDLSPTPREVVTQPWSPQPTPEAAGLLAHGAGEALRSGFGLGRRLVGAAAQPRRFAAGLTERVSGMTEVAGGLAEVAGAFLRPAPRTVLNARPGPHRSYLVVEQSLAEVKAAKSASGGTVNDVVLTTVAVGLKRLLGELGTDTGDLTLRACVPVSVRTAAGRGAAGNQITIMAAPLPVGDMAIGDRFAAVHAAMDGLKRSRQALGGQALTQMENFMPPTVLAQASRLGFSSRLYNVLVTNVPGPQFPVYLAGRRLRQVFPVPFLAAEHRVAVAIVSYDGRLFFGLLGDRDAVPDLGPLATGISDGLAELAQP